MTYKSLWVTAMLLYGADGYSIGGGWFAYVDHHQCVAAATTFSREAKQELEKCILYREDVFLAGQKLMAAGHFSGKE